MSQRAGRVLAGLVVAAVTAGLAPGAGAGGVNVSPTKIRLEPRSRTASLRVKNSTSTKVALQVEVRRWRQDPVGRDWYEDTEDIVFHPKILTVEGNGSQVVRLGYETKWPEREQTYRIYVRELPRVIPEHTGVRVALRIGVPVILAPAKDTKPAGEVAEVALQAGRLVTKVHNTGEVHFSPQKLLARGLDAKGQTVFEKPFPGWYVLPLATRSFDLALEPEECRKAATLEVSMKVGDKEIRGTTSVDAGRCGGSSAGAPPPRAAPGEQTAQPAEK